MREIAILGSTGSIGLQTLEVLEHLGEGYRVVGLAAGRRFGELAEQARRFRPRAVVIGDPALAGPLRDLLQDQPVKVLAGPAGLLDLVAMPGLKLVVAAMVGVQGLAPTLAAVEAGIDVALANKETLVAGGALVMAASRRSGSRILPVDSEHNAIFQCLRGEEAGSVRRVLLTASGGPFRGRTAAGLAGVTPQEALRHPRWDMGPKITIDSATLMNKGLEVLEAHHLFDVSLDQIEVVVHPQSIVHSLVEFHDGSVKAQLGWPDMRLAIQEALTYPVRVPRAMRPLDLTAVGRLGFERPDLETFPALEYAYQAGRTGGTMPVVLNASNEVAVEAFLQGRIPFTAIPRIILTAMENHIPRTPGSLDVILEIDRETRRQARSLLARWG